MRIPKWSTGLSTSTGTVQLSIHSALSAGMSVGLAHLLGLEYPIYAMIAAVIATDLSPAQTRRLGWRRLAGTVLGASVGAALSQLPPGPLAITISILVAMMLSHLLTLRGAAVLTATSAASSFWITARNCGPTRSCA